jgi:hypothetical protein
MSCVALKNLFYDVLFYNIRKNTTFVFFIRRSHVGRDVLVLEFALAPLISHHIPNSFLPDNEVEVNQDS